MIQSINFDDYRISVSHVGVGVAVAALTYLALRYLWAPKEQDIKREERAKTFDRVVVILPQSTSFKDMSFVKKVAAIARKILPGNVKIELRPPDYLSCDEFFQHAFQSPESGVEIEEDPWDPARIPWSEYPKMYVLHDSVPDPAQGSSFPQEHIFDMKKIGQKSNTSDFGVYKLFCLKEEDIAESYENSVLKHFSSLLPQRAMYLGNLDKSFQDWPALLSFASSILYAQKFKLFSLYLPGKHFSDLRILDGFVTELLAMMKDHPNKPDTIEFVLPDQHSDYFLKKKNLYPCEKRDVVCGRNGQEFSVLAFSVASTSSRRSLRIILPGEISPKDLTRLYWSNQHQTHGDSSFSEWLSSESSFLKHLIALANAHELKSLANFLQKYRRDQAFEFSFEQCEAFAKDWMDPQVQIEAQKLRECIQQEYYLTEWMQQKLAPLIREPLTS